MDEAPQYRNFCNLIHNHVDMQWLLGPDIATKMEEVVKVQKLSQSISARFHPYQRLSTSIQRPFWGLPEGTGRAREVTPVLSASQGNHQQRRSVDQPRQENHQPQSRFKKGRDRRR